MPKLGKVLIVGAGPGAPDLLTVRAVRSLEQAEVLLYDRLVHPQTLAIAPSQAIRIDVGKTVGDPHDIRQNQIFDLMVDYARQGKTVVRIKGGDPFIFGRGAEEIEVLIKNGIAWEVVPGLSSALVAPLAANIPLTYRGIAASFGVFTPSIGKGLPERDLQAAAHVDTAVFLMGVRQIQRIQSDLLAAGKSPSTPVAVIENATWDNQKVHTTNLGSLHLLEGQIQAPAAIVVGETVQVLNQTATQSWAHAS
ncbi:MAG: uroporphyrinogen-III C-methyltransferase [Acidobacteria bacterium]|nr:uroporphyrinogen-III C-methyltransferase [Acidobacteriota bacterium]